MDGQQNSLEEQLSEALHENAALRQGLDECARAKKKAEQELETERRNVKAIGDELEHIIYAVSHDLRQPLRTISSYTQLLQRQLALDEQATEMTAFIVDAAHELKVLIDDLVKYSRIGKSLRPTAVGLGTVVQWAALNLQTSIQETKAEIISQDLPELVVDESQFVQLFQQLISNCLKYKSDTPPRVEISTEERDDGYLVSVKDNGVGIEPQYHETVFAPFKRLHGKDVPGTGLGLAIAKKIVKAHGGLIWVESDGKNGSVVRFTVPST